MAVLCNEVEEAFVNLIKGLGVWPDAADVESQSTEDKSLPAIICLADGDSVEEEPKGTGNFWVNVTVAVKGRATETDDLPDPHSAHVALVNAVFSGLLVDDLDAQLNAQGRQLTVFPNGFIVSSPKHGTDEGDLLVDELLIRLYCCASVLAP